MRNPLEPLEQRRQNLAKPQPRWPATCNFCGAPLQGSTCPRCHYERQREGKVVWTGVPGESPVIPKGTAVSATSPLTVTGISLRQGSTLHVSLLIIADNGGPFGATATWNGVALTSRALAGPNCSLVETMALINATAGTGSLVVTQPDPELVGIAVIITEILGLTAYDKLGHAEGTGTTASTTTISNTTQANDLLVATVSTQGETSPEGTWGAGLAPSQSVSVGGATPVFCGYTGGRISTAWQALNVIGSPVINKTFPSSVTWIAVIDTLKRS